MKTLISLLFLTFFLSSCYYIAAISKEPDPSFEKVKGIHYTEVRREFGNGTTMDKNGFHLEPEWQIHFTGDDSVKIFSAIKKKYMPYRIFHSHDNLFQFARQWFRVKHVSKDSIILQVMVVSDRRIHEDESNVYMKLYADDYIKNRLHTNMDLLRVPNLADSLYAKSRAIEANTDPDSAFAARTPVIFKSKSKIAHAEKIRPDVDPNLGEFESIDSYFNPVYKITINKAYQDFTYSFYATVDHTGKITFKKFRKKNVMPEFLETKTKVAKGIINVYLRNLFEITPGKTLGYPHSSIVEVHVIGKKLKM